MPGSWPRRTDHAPGDPNFPDDINEIEEALNELNLRNPITSGGQVADGAVAALLDDDASNSAQALNTKIAAEVDPVAAEVAGRLSEASLDTLIATGVETKLPTTAPSMESLPLAPAGFFGYNSAPWNQDYYVEHGGFLYAVWIAAGSRYGYIGKRPAAGGEWSVFNLQAIAGNPFAFPNFNDGHNSIALGVDSSGYLHVAANHHDSPLRYARSTNPGDITAWTVPGMVGTLETSITYPKFVNTPAGLLCIYREGGSGNGVCVVNRFAPGTLTWARLGVVLDGVVDNVSPYIDQVVRDPESGRIHIFGCWRGTGSADTNHHVYHLCSDDDGATWKAIDGTAVTTPATRSTVPTPVTTALSGSGVINQVGAGVDADGWPHRVGTINDSNGKWQIHHVWHDGTQWRTKIETAYPDAVSLAASTPVLPFTRPSVVCTPDGRTFAVFAHSRRRGAILARDITPTAKGLPNLGEFPIASIDMQMEPTTSTSQVARGKVMLTVLSGGGSATEDLRRSAGGLLTIDTAALPRLAFGQSRLPSIPVVTSHSLATTVQASGTLELVPSFGKMLIPRGFDKQHLATRLSAVIGGGSGSLFVISRPRGAGGATVQELQVTAAGTWGTPWCSLPMTDGVYDGGTLEVRVTGSLSIQALTLDLGVMTDAQGRVAAGALEPVGTYPIGTKLFDFDAATLGLANGASVASWTDVSGFNRVLTQATAGQQPVYNTTGLNGKPAVVFDGTNDVLNGEAFSIGATYTLFVVGFGTTGALLSQDTSTIRQYQLSIGSSLLTAIGFTGANAASTDTTAATHGTPFIAEMVRGSSSVEAVANGVSDGATTGATATDKTTTLVVGGRYSGSTLQSPLNGTLARLVAYSGALSSAERSSVRSSLAAQYGITL